jgi:proteasome lid subunit RPN8/RPN11
MIRMPAPLVDRIRREAARAYPEECCGVLLGRGGARDREILELRPVANARRTERERRYLIPPDALRRIEMEARGTGLVAVGFYHSHPDHPAEPSQFDRDHAWPWYSYLIVSVRAGIPGTPRSWRLADDRSRFREDKMTETPPRGVPST